MEAYPRSQHLRGSRTAVPQAKRVATRRGELLEVLRCHGVTNPEIFGSAARGDDREDSDVDLLVDFAPRTDIIGIKRELEDVLGVPVDLVPRNGLKERVRSHARRTYCPCESPRRRPTRRRRLGHRLGHRVDPRAPQHGPISVDVVMDAVDIGSWRSAKGEKNQSRADSERSPTSGGATSRTCVTSLAHHYFATNAEGEGTPQKQLRAEDSHPSELCGVPEAMPTSA